MKSGINIMLADSDIIFRQETKELLELNENINIIAQASNCSDAIRDSKKMKPDLILIDIDLPGINCFETIKEIKREKSDSKIIVLTTLEDKNYMFKTLQAGADGYLLKSSVPHVLLGAINDVYNGMQFIQPNMTRELIKEFNRVTLHGCDNNDKNTLTKRETDVLKLIAEGMFNKEIAKLLYISEKTVKNHLSSIFKKLNVSDRTQAAIYAYKHNISS